jgi:hypothetical protein
MLNKDEILRRTNSGKNAQIDPLKTVESDHPKLCFQISKKLSSGLGSKSVRYFPD